MFNTLLLFDKNIKFLIVFFGREAGQIRRQGPHAQQRSPTFLQSINLDLLNCNRILTNRDLLPFGMDEGRGWSTLARWEKQPLTKSTRKHFHTYIIIQRHRVIYSTSLVPSDFLYFQSRMNGYHLQVNEIQNIIIIE